MYKTKHRANVVDCSTGRITHRQGSISASYLIDVNKHFLEAYISNWQFFMYAELNYYTYCYTRCILGMNT